MAGAGGKSQANDRQARPCPDDFDIVFIEQGRLECESWYRARRTTVTRWLIERGKKALLKKRAAFVKHQRNTKKRTKAEGSIDERQDKRKVDPRMVALAIAFLQRRENGGWVVVPCECGQSYVVGTRRRTAAEVIDIAVRKGFNKRRAMDQINAFAESV